MSKYTNLKLHRKFEKVGKGDIVPRSEILPVVERKEVECPVCHKPIYISVGQIIYCHRECKKRLKRGY